MSQYAIRSTFIEGDGIIPSVIKAGGAVRCYAPLGVSPAGRLNACSLASSLNRRGRYRPDWRPRLLWRGESLWVAYLREMLAFFLDKAYPLLTADGMRAALYGSIEVVFSRGIRSDDRCHPNQMGVGMDILHSVDSN